MGEQGRHRHPSLTSIPLTAPNLSVSTQSHEARSSRTCVMSSMSFLRIIFKHSNPDPMAGDVAAKLIRRRVLEVGVSHSFSVRRPTATNFILIFDLPSASKSSSDGKIRRLRPSVLQCNLHARPTIQLEAARSRGDQHAQVPRFRARVRQLGPFFLFRPCREGTSRG